MAMLNNQMVHMDVIRLRPCSSVPSKLSELVLRRGLSETPLLLRSSTLAALNNWAKSFWSAQLDCLEQVDGQKEQWFHMEK